MTHEENLNGDFVYHPDHLHAMVYFIKVIHRDNATTSLVKNMFG